MQTDGEPSGGVRVSGGLGVRPLPLLSDAAYASFQSGRHGAEAILEVAQRVFGDAYSAFYEVSVWERSRQRSIGGEGVNDLGVARDIVQHALSSNSPSEGDVLTLSAYLLLEAEDRSIDSTTPLYVAGAAEVLGMALAEGAAGRYGTCDSMLAFAHARSLAWVSTPDAVDSLFDAATAVCGEDVTAAVAKGYYDLGYASVGAGAGDDPCRVDAATISLDSWKPILREFRAIQKSAPGNPAGYVGEGDTYRIAAELLSQWNVEPFTIRSFRAAAIRAYQKARSFSSDEDIAKSMAKVYVAQGDSDEAERMLSGTATDEHSASALALRSDIAAAERDYEEAGQLAQQSWDADLNDSSDRYLRIRQLQGSNAAFGATDVTGGEDSAGANVLGQRACGGVSLTHDRSLAPAYRRSEDGFPEQPQLGYWVLAKEWNRADGEACTYAAAQADVLACEVLASQGQVEGLSNAANDYYQNLLRSVGDLEGAARVAHSWAASAPLSPTAHERLGEIAFLQHDWLKAKSESSTAADLYVEDPDPIGAYSVSTGAQWARLRQGSADRESGDSRASLAVLEPLAEELDGQSLTAHEYEAVLHMDVEQELGLAEYDRNEFDTAIDHFERSIEIGRYAEASLSAKVLRGVQAQAASTAALKLGRLDGAAAFAQQAVDIDPYNPLFRETLAEAERGRDRGAAIASYRAALEEDASMFSTWNNLGVLLVQVGDVDEALEAFYQSVDIRPDYPIGWFNIGVVEGSRPGFRHFLRSQGALGKAGSLDHDYRDRDTSLAFDDEIYDSGLDLSQPIPKDWQLASTQRSRPSKLGLGLVFLVMLRVAWALGSDWAVGRSYEHTITKEAPKWPRLRRILESRPTAWWTSVVSLVGLLLLTGVSGTREAALGLVLFTALLAAHALAPRFAHHGDTRLRQASFLPASIFTAALVPLGLGFTPPAPLSNDDVQVSPLVRRSGALTLGLLTAALACVAWLTAVPVARTGATAGLLLVSSALVPVAPLDGARLDLSKAREVGVALAIAGGTVLFAAGVI